ncbi:MAG: DUF3737 family protein [archaeon]|nr:DUF3737 family protein [archaeon]
MTAPKETIIENQTSGIERAFYGTRNTHFKNIKIQGEEDGESAFKECRNITVEDSLHILRYPYWHNDNLVMKNLKFEPTARASIWYCNNVEMLDTNLNAIKALRNCTNVKINNSDVISDEFGWKTDGFKCDRMTLKGHYAFFECNNLYLDNFELDGKYSFQYCTNVTILNSKLKTKDALWHAKNVYCKNCQILGEYLSWYSENVVLENCHIESVQPLCYCKKLKLINCTMDNCNLAFEYSDVEADVHSRVDSIKNILSGKVIVDSYGEYVTDDPVYECHGVVEVRKKEEEKKEEKSTFKKIAIQEDDDE